MKSHSAVLLGATGLWLALFGLTCFYEQEIEAALWVMSAFWWLGVFLSGVGLIVWSAVWLIKRQGRLVPLIALLLPSAAFLFLHFVGTAWIQEARFQYRFHNFDRKRYEAVVARIQAAEPPMRKRIAGRDCEIDSGPPLRVAFVQPGGLLDNWVGVVYDPTGLVMKANHFKGDWSNWDDPKLARVKKLFGGDLLWAEPLGGPWYRCGFT